MKSNNVIQDKSYQFALKIVNVASYLQTEKREFVLSKQLLRSGTSIGANVEESIRGQSEKDFLSKISIAYKEARETRYWLRLLKDSHLIIPNEADPLLGDCEELLKILGAIQKTIKSRNS